MIDDKKPQFYVFKLVAWAVATWATFNFTALLERVYQYTGELTTQQVLYTGVEYSTRFNSNINLFNEPIAVYLSLTLAGISAAMFCRELLGFHKFLRSLVVSEIITSSGVKN